MKYNYYIKKKENVFYDINAVAKNTYLLLSMTIILSAIMAAISIKLNINKISAIYYFIISIGLLYSIEKFKDSIIGLLLVFIFTSFEGLYLGPILKPIISTKNGQELIILSLTLTGFIFLSLSIYVLISKKNFEFLKGFILIGFITIIGLFLSSFFIKIIIINALISGLIIILSSSIILYETSSIINGEETNYISATINLYLQIYNIFLNILNLLNIFSSKE